MKALVTGATGMLGRHMVTRLLDEGVSVRAFVRPTSDVRFLRSVGVDLVYGRVADRASMCVAVRGCDWVFHVAGYVSANAPFEVNEGERLPELYQTVNVDFTQRLLEVSEAEGVGRFVYASSASVYGLDVPVPTPESAVSRPGSHYGHSKQQAEQLVQACQARGLSTTIIRPSVIYGPNDRHFLPSMRPLTNALVVPLVNGGHNLLDLVYVADVVQVLWLASQAPQADGQIYNAGPGQPVSLRDFLLAYGSLTGRRPRIVSVSPKMMGWLARPVYPLLQRFIPAGASALSPKGISLMTQDFHLDTTHAQTQLNYHPHYPLTKGLTFTLTK